MNGMCRGVRRAHKTELEMLTLERSLAYEWCCSIIDGHVRQQADNDGREYYDLTTVEAGETEEIVLEAVGYLEWRGLIERDSHNDNFIEILDEGAVEVSVELHD